MPDMPLYWYERWFLDEHMLTSGKIHKFLNFIPSRCCGLRAVMLLTVQRSYHCIWLVKQLTVIRVLAIHRIVKIKIVLVPSIRYLV